MSRPSASSNLDPPVGTDGAFCPACGYDLRGAPTERCPECGLHIDSDILRVSGIPWAHRHTMGRAWAYLRTVRMVTFGSEAIALEPARPQDPSDARAFHRLHGTLLSLVFLGVFALAIWRGDHGFASLAVQPANAFGFGAIRKDAPPWTQDLSVPWSAGATMPPVLPVCLVALAFHVTGVQRSVFRLPRPLPLAQRLRARSLSAYASAPLIFLAATALCFGGILWLEKELPEIENDRSMQFITRALSLAGTAFLLFTLITTFLRVGRWVAQARHCGFARAMLGVVELLALWLAGAVVLLGLLPWSVGFLRIVFDSLR